MRNYRLAAVTVVALALTFVSACKESTTSSPSGTITCGSADAAVCPASNLTLGFNGGSGAPSIAPTNSNTGITATSSAFPVSGTTSATTNGYWFLVTDGTLRTYGVLTVSGGTFAGTIPLFCGAQQIIYRFDNASGRSYWYANVTLSSCTTTAFRAQLTWDTGPSSSDIDLHLLRPSGSMFSGNDCYFGNCKVAFLPAGLEWGTTGAAGNPSLDVDNTQGYGPENIVIASGAETGDYRIIIDNWNGVLSTHATVKIFFGDVEAARYTSLALDYASNREYWEVAKVNILTHTITAVNTYSASTPVAAGVAAGVAPVKQ